MRNKWMDIGDLGAGDLWCCSLGTDLIGQDAD